MIGKTAVGITKCFTRLWLPVIFVWPILWRENLLKYQKMPSILIYFSSQRYYIQMFSENITLSSLLHQRGAINKQPYLKATMHCLLLQIKHFVEYDQLELIQSGPEVLEIYTNSITTMLNICWLQGKPPGEKPRDASQHWWMASLVNPLGQTDVGTDVPHPGESNRALNQPNAQQH